MKWPLKTNVIRRNMLNHTFGMVRKDAKGNPRAHQGWDFQAAIGTPFRASLDGVVESIYESTSYGLVLIIWHESIERYFAYAHLSEVSVKEGDAVKIGQWLGKTGESGNAKGMAAADQHLHFEVRTEPRPAGGLVGRESPIKFFYICPLKEAIVD